MKTGVLGSTGWGRRLGGVGSLLKNLGGSDLLKQYGAIEKVDEALFQMIIDLFVAIGEMDLDVPDYSVDHNLVSFVDFLLSQTIQEADGYGVEGLVKTLAKLREKVPEVKHHNLVCEWPLRRHHPHLVKLLGLEPNRSPLV